MMNHTLMALTFVLSFQLPTVEELSQPFGGFDEESMKPIFALFHKDSQGRQLLGKSIRKLGFRKREDLIGILSSCSSKHPGPAKRQGLFMLEKAVIYRLKDGDGKWRSMTAGAMEKYEDPERYPLFASRLRETANFEIMDLAWEPRICIKKGLPVLDTYLVLVHELTHLIGNEPFRELEIFFDQGDMIREYYFPELEKSGGESEAYVAQMKALQSLQNLYDLEVVSKLDGFLTKNGRLSYRDKPVFLTLLLEEAGYQAEFDFTLQDRVVRVYNSTHFLWELLTGNMELMDRQLEKIEAAHQKLEKVVSEAGKNISEADKAAIAEQRGQIRAARKANRDRFRRYSREALEYETLMLRIDETWPDE